MNAEKLATKLCHIYVTYTYMSQTHVYVSYICYIYDRYIYVKHTHVYGISSTETILQNLGLH